MLRRSGQAATGFLHLLAEIVLGLVLLAVLAGGVLAWRLAEGPLDLSFLIPRLEAALNGTPAAPQVTIGAAALAWEGFRHGLGSPLDLVLADVVVRSADGSGSATIPRAEVSLSATELLVGRIVPRRIVIEEPRLRVVRDTRGQVALSFGRRRGANEPTAATAGLLGEILAALTTPPANDQSPSVRRFPELSQLRILAIHGAELTVVDQALGATWYAPTANITFERGPLGGLSGNALIALALNGKHAELTVQASLEDRRGLSVEARLSQITPAELAAIIPRLKPLAALNAPVRLTADLQLGAALALQRFRLEADAGAGKVSIGGGAVPIASGALELEAGSDNITLRQIVLRLAGPGGAPGPMLTGKGTAARDAAGTWRGELSASTNAVPMAELARYWPPGIARGGRAWVTGNITAGTAGKATLALAVKVAPGLDDVTLESVSGAVSATGLTVHWLRPIPPLTAGEATLSITNPDALTIRVQHAAEGKLIVQSGQVQISGLEQHDQEASVAAQITGPLADAISLLALPRLHLLARHPLPLKGASGTTDTALMITLPLLDKVTMDQVKIGATATLTAVHLGAIAAGHDLDQGALSLAADNDRLTVSGHAALAGVPTRLTYAMDFRAGSSSQVVQRLDAEATVTAKTLHLLGFADTEGLLEGPIALALNLTEKRNGKGEARLHAGLTDARLTLAPLGFSKLPGAEAAAEATISLVQDQVESIDSFALTGQGIAVSGSASFASGHPVMITIGHAAIGRTEATGSVRFAVAQEPMAIVLSGPVLDLSSRFAPHVATAPPPAEPAASPAEPGGARGPPFVLDAHFGRALLAKDRPLADCALHAESDGRRITTARLTGDLGPGQPLAIDIAPDAKGRALTVSTADAGVLLADADVTDRVQGGALSLTAQYDDAAAAADPPLSGSAEITDFRVQKAPALGRILQAMTLYGLAQVLEGPGLGFSKLVAPFRLAGNRLSLAGARAYSPSLGLTMQGDIDLAARTVDLSGTIVPAYFFNSLLGDIPLIGRIFSPEKGGGLFAATYTLEGALDDPKVVVNPLAALTPGFLRGLFSMFNEKKP